MNVPRLREEETEIVRDLGPHNDLLHTLLAWVQDLMAEKSVADTAISWEDGEDRTSEATEDF
ncbi:MAG TPA: hypothetical protein VG757_12550 [Devosia sp.]|nr:hypothetical protein [Devosia sp.]